MPYRRRTAGWYTIGSSDFISVDTTGVRAKRKSDGSLPDITYMHLIPGDRMVDAGVNVGLPYAGSAPDLGCFETAMTGVKDVFTSAEIVYYPNPVISTMTIHMKLLRGGHCKAALYDMSGRFVRMIVDEDLEPGEFSGTTDFSDVKDGLYICRINIDGVRVASGKIMKMGKSTPAVK